MKILKQLGAGTHYCGWFKGYISIDVKGHNFDVMWTSDKDTHDPFGHSAVSVEFTPHGIGMVCKSVLTMHIVPNETRPYYIKFVEEKINRAYKKKCNT